MRSAVRLIPLLLVLSACSHDAHPSSSSASVADAMPREGGSVRFPNGDDLYSISAGFGPRHMVLQALADTAAKFAALEIDRTPTFVGPWQSTTRLLAAQRQFTLAYWVQRSGGVAWRSVWGAVNGSVVLQDTTARTARVVMLSQYGSREVALVELERDGACPAAYRIVEYSPWVRTTVTPEFGNCGRPAIHRRDMELRLRFAASPGHPAQEVEYLGHGIIHRAGQPAPTLYPDSLYMWSDDETRAIAGMWRAGRYAAGADTTELHAWIATPAGPFVLSRTSTEPFPDHHMRAALGDSTVLRDYEHSYTGLDSYLERGGRPVALVMVDDGGNGCGGMYRIVSTVGRETPVITDEFGSCGSPSLRLDGARMDMHFEPYYTYAVSMAPGFVEPPDQGYRYRGGGKVERIY